MGRGEGHEFSGRNSSSKSKKDVRRGSRGNLLASRENVESFSAYLSTVNCHNSNTRNRPDNLTSRVKTYIYVLQNYSIFFCDLLYMCENENTCTFLSHAGNLRNCSSFDRDEVLFLFLERITEQVSDVV